MPRTDTIPLIEAIKAEDIVEFKRLIESEGTDIHQKDGYQCGWSPILWGPRRGYLDIVEFLLSKGASIHDKTFTGWSPILCGSFYGHINLVDLLLSKGASLQDKVSVDGSTCFTYARHPRLNPVPYLKHGVLYRLRKWPTTMAILILTELNLICRIDGSSLIDLHQYIGTEDFTFNNEDEYTL